MLNLPPCRFAPAPPPSASLVEHEIANAGALVGYPHGDPGGEESVKIRPYDELPNETDWVATQSDFAESLGGLRGPSPESTLSYSAPPPGRQQQSAKRKRGQPSSTPAPQGKRSRRDHSHSNNQAANPDLLMAPHLLAILDNAANATRTTDGNFSKKSQEQRKQNKKFEKHLTALKSLETFHGQRRQTYGSAALVSGAMGIGALFIALAAQRQVTEAASNLAEAMDTHANDPDVHEYGLQAESIKEVIHLPNAATTGVVGVAVGLGAMAVTGTLGVLRHRAAKKEREVQAVAQEKLADKVSKLAAGNGANQDLQRLKIAATAGHAQRQAQPSAIPNGNRTLRNRSRGQASNRSYTNVSVADNTRTGDSSIGF
eukprot:GHVT01086656.1.p1 GENE.GHVT01086656.1~~GHVT01086656.1.p1  ORF type:complete len:372 (-),score=71.95 GHVT01086656.1:927-2042(-)